jgi:plasmid stability protein
MKATVDLPDDLAAEVQRRAATGGRDLAGEVVDLLRQGLSAATSPAPTAGAQTTTPSGNCGGDHAGQVAPKHLPLIKARPIGPTGATALTAQQMCDFLKDVEQQLEVERFERALGHQHLDRAGP